MRRQEPGFSFIEILVVLGAVGVIGIVAASAIITTTRGVKRSDSDSKIKDSLSYTLTIIERHIRSAKTVSCTTPSSLSYVDKDDISGSFFYRQVVTSGKTFGYVASGSATVKLTGPEVNVKSATFVCTPAVGNSPPSVTVNLSGEDATITGIEQGNVDASTKIFLRTAL